MIELDIKAMHNSDRARLESALHVTLDAMLAGRDLSHRTVQTEMASVKCVDRPVCALAVAAHASESWD